MNKPSETYLQYGSLAPDFSLQAANGQTVTRHQYRNKHALVLIFFSPSSDVMALFKALSADSDEYQELNARILGIVEASQAEVERLDVNFALPLTLLADPDGAVWSAYSGKDTPGVGVFILDLYGEVDSQQVGTSIKDLPDTKMILAWTRAAQYRCNI